MKEINYFSTDENIYEKILIYSDTQKKRDIYFSKVTDEIGRDLDRTFYEGIINSKEGQNKLNRVLTSLAYVRPEIGYCQGMNFIAGALIQFIDEEEIVFWIFLSFLDEKELNSLYFKVKIN
jgi:hypothetical protein